MNKNKNKNKNINKQIKINLGDSNAWKKRNNLKDWLTVDCYHQGDYSIDLRNKTRLPFASNSVDIVFSSHMIEHINNDGDKFLFKEVHRILKPNGVFRVACPDYDKAMIAYENKDVTFFTKGGVATKGKSIERLVTNYFASFRNKNYKGNVNYSGGPIINVNEAKQIFASNDINAIVSWCVNKIPKDAHYKAHINGFNFEKLRDMLKVSGFTNIKRSAFRKSKLVQLRKPCFDNRPVVSLYVECIKTVKKHIGNTDKLNQKIYSYNPQRNLFMCLETGHGYYHYSKNINDFHKKVYRTTKRAHRPGDFDLNGKLTTVFHRNRQVICSKRVNIVKKYLKKSYTCLDVGGGAGTFCSHIKKYINRIELIELDPILTQEAKKLGFVAHNISFFKFITPKKYDIVFAWHVLEHVENIVKFVTKCKNLSKKYIVIEVPTRRVTPDEHKVPKEFDGHLHYFTVESLKMLLEQCGLNIIEIGTDNAVQKPAILAICDKNK